MILTCIINQLDFNAGTKGAAFCIPSGNDRVAKATTKSDRGLVTERSEPIAESDVGHFIRSEFAPSGGCNQNLELTSPHTRHTSGPQQRCRRTSHKGEDHSVHTAAWKGIRRRRSWSSGICGSPSLSEQATVLRRWSHQTVPGR